MGHACTVRANQGAGSGHRIQLLLERQASRREISGWLLCCSRIREPRPPCRSFVAPSGRGLGLWARVALVPGQLIGEYAGPRLPLRLLPPGKSGVQIPGSDVVIDGAGESAPFAVPRHCASFAVHSRKPNARLELWPVRHTARKLLDAICNQTLRNQNTVDHAIIVHWY